MVSERHGAGAVGPGFASLSPEKRALLARRLHQRRSNLAAGALAPAVIRPRDPDAPRVMSPAQRRLFLLDQAFPGLTAYNVVQIFQIDGPLDVTALRRALDDVARRHEILRTRISVEADGERLEVAEGGADFAVIDTPTDLAAAVRLGRVEVGTRFDLGRDTLLRARLFVVSAEQHVLVLATHHIASDAESKQVINRELALLYRSYITGEQATLSGPVLQYADYAAWLATTDDSQAESLRWWREHLRGIPEETALPVDRPRPSRPSFAGHTHGVSLDRDTTRRLDAFARQHKATLFMVLLAGYAAVLESHCRQGDLVIGSPTSGRHHDQLSDVVGLFLNTLPLRIDTSGDPSFRTLIARVKAAAVDGFRHQAVPFEEIVDAVRPSRDTSRNPLYQTMFTLRGGTATGLQLAGLHVEPVPFDSGWSKFDLGLVCYPVANGGMRLIWQYSTDLFDRTHDPRDG